MHLVMQELRVAWSFFRRAVPTLHAVSRGALVGDRHFLLSMCKKIEFYHPGTRCALKVVAVTRIAVSVQCGRGITL